MTLTDEAFQIALAVSQESPAALAHLSSNGTIKPYPHIMEIDAALRAVTAGDLNKLILELPPQHGKTYLASKTFPAWHLGKRPDHRIICASYSSGLSRNASRDNRDLIDEWGLDGHGVLPIAIRADSRNVLEWHLREKRGGLSAVGVGSGTTGKPSDLLIIDDPVKDYKEAMSKAFRDGLWDWYTSVSMLRLSKVGSQIIIMTRWHEDDLVGRARNASDDWKVITFPAINDSGEALCPELHPLSQLEEFREVIGAYKWSCLYQQKPISPEECKFKPHLFDSIFDWQSHVQTNDNGWPGPLRHRVIAVDKSWGGDWTAIVELGITEPRDGFVYIRVNMFRTDDPDKLCHNICEVIQKGDTRFPDLVWVEEINYKGRDYGDLTHKLRGEMTSRRFPLDHVIKSVSPTYHNLDTKPKGNLKSHRILELLPLFTRKKARLLDTPGGRRAVEQFVDFRPGKDSGFDDGPDAIARAWEALAKVI